LDEILLGVNYAVKEGLARRILNGTGLILRWDLETQDISSHAGIRPGMSGMLLHLI